MNTVLLYCRCGLTVYFQSPHPHENQWPHTDLPSEVAAEFDGRSKLCPRCERRLTLRTSEPKYVSMEVEYGELPDV